MTYEDQDDGLPVLNAVVETGNESIIQSSRLGREVLRELDMLQQSKPVKFELQEHLLEDQQKNDDVARRESRLDLGIDRYDVSCGANNLNTIDSKAEIELMIDEVVDRHIHELRKDIRRLLVRVKQEP